MSCYTTLLAFLKWANQRREHAISKDSLTKDRCQTLGNQRDSRWTTKLLLRPYPKKRTTNKLALSWGGEQPTVTYRMSKKAQKIPSKVLPNKAKLFSQQGKISHSTTLKFS